MECFRRSLRENDHWLSQDLGNLKVHLLCPWNVPSIHCPHSGNHFKEVALRAQCVVKTIWTDSDRTQLRSPVFYKCKSGRLVKRSPCLVPPNTNHLCKFLCLLKLVPTNLLVSSAELHSWISSEFGQGQLTGLCGSGRPIVKVCSW